MCLPLPNSEGRPFATSAVIWPTGRGDFQPAATLLPLPRSESGQRRELREKVPHERVALHATWRIVHVVVAAVIVARAGKGTPNNRIGRRASRVLHACGIVGIVHGGGRSNASV